MSISEEIEQIHLECRSSKRYRRALRWQWLPCCEKTVHQSKTLKEKNIDLHHSFETGGLSVGQGNYEPNK